LLMKLIGSFSFLGHMLHYCNTETCAEESFMPEELAK
jgi:hypothetical protein